MQVEMPDEGGKKFEISSSKLEPNDEVESGADLGALQPAPPKLMDCVRNKMRVLHLSKRTEEAYVGWISRYIHFHRELRGEWVHPVNLGNGDVNEFLTHLAVDREVAASTQNQAFSALLFLYTRVLGKELKVDAVRAKTPQRLPTVLSKEEVNEILSKIPLPRLLESRKKFV
jgi:site-specific recombinase XerD